MDKNIVRRTIAIIGLSTSIAMGVGMTGSATASEDDNKFKNRSEHSTGSQSSADSRSVLSIEQIVSKVKGNGFTEVYEVERERGIYEVKARDAKGVLMELYVDATTGKTLKSKREN